MTQHAIRVDDLPDYRQQAGNVDPPRNVERKTLLCVTVAVTFHIRDT